MTEGWHCDELMKVSNEGEQIDITRRKEKERKEKKEERFNILFLLERSSPPLHLLHALMAMIPHRSCTPSTIEALDSKKKLECFVTSSRVQLTIMTLPCEDVSDGVVHGSLRLLSLFSYIGCDYPDPLTHAALTPCMVRGRKKVGAVSRLSSRRLSLDPTSHSHSPELNAQMSPYSLHYPNRSG